MLAAFFLGAAFVFSAAAIVLMIGVMLGGKAEASLPGVLLFCFIGGVQGVVLRALFLRGFARGMLSMSPPAQRTPAKDIHLPLFEPNLSPEQRVLAHLVRSDATVAELAALFASAIDAEQTIRALITAGAIELFTPHPPPGGRVVSIDAFEAKIRSNPRGILGLRDITAQITELGTQRAAS